MSSEIKPLIINDSPKIDITNNIDEIDIEYSISGINYEGMMCGNIKEITNNFIDIIKENLIEKHKDLDYYIQGEYGDYLPSPFSSANYVDYMIPSVLLNFIYSKLKEYKINIRFYSNNKDFNYLNINKYPTYCIKIHKLN